MSLTTIRTYGWLTGTSQVRNIGTYGWFAVGGPPPVFPTPVSFAFQVPLAYRGIILQNFSVPVEINSDVTLVTSEKSTPIERLSSLLITDVVSSDFLAQFSRTRKIAVGNTKQINQFNLSPTEYLQALTADRIVPVENKSDAIIVTSEKSIPIGHLLYLSDQEKVAVEYGGITVAVSAAKMIPVEHLKNVVLFPSIPIEEMDTPKAWYLDERGVLWILDARTTNWLLAARERDWTIPGRIKDWILDGRSIAWIIEERD